MDVWWLERIILEINCFVKNYIGKLKVADVRKNKENKREKIISYIVRYIDWKRNCIDKWI